MSFNLRNKKSKRPIDRLRSLSEDCSNLKPSDLDGISEQELHHFLYDIKKTAGIIKEAYHGEGSTFLPTGPDFNPYKTSPLVNNQGPEFGGRWRKDMPGAGGAHINDDSDTPKSGAGEGDDFDEGLHKQRINNLLDGIKGGNYIIKKRLTENEKADKNAT